MKSRIIFAGIALNVTALAVLFYLVAGGQPQVADQADGPGQQQASTGNPFLDRFNDGVDDDYYERMRADRERYDNDRRLNDLRRDTDRRIGDLEDCVSELRAGSRVRRLC